MTPRNVTFVGAICILIGWLLASTLTPPVARVQTLPEQTKPEKVSPDPAPVSEQLQLRLQQLRPTPVGRRNPFVFATSERARESEPPAPRPEVAVAEPLPIVSTPAYTLSGIGISGDERTAVLASADDVQIVRVNDLVGGYVVAEISESSVTLQRGAERHVLRFAQ